MGQRSLGGLAGGGLSREREGAREERQGRGVGGDGGRRLGRRRLGRRKGERVEGYLRGKGEGKRERDKGKALRGGGLCFG